MSNMIQQLRDEVDVEWMLDRTEQLWRKERGQCCGNYREAAIFIEELMGESGLDRVERIPFPADGKTSFQDKTMPMAWEATCGKLTVRGARVPFGDPVVADYQRHPFHLIRGSTSTPPEGVLTRLITEEQLFGGEDTQNVMVITDPDTSARREIYTAACDLGALGIVSDDLVGRYETPDAIQWANCFTEGDHWHILNDDRPLIGFSVSPKTGDKLRASARAGETLVHVVSDGRRYEGEIDAVTAVLPGEDARELWVLAHLYEPLADDNSAGVISAVAIARALKRLAGRGAIPPLRFTLRLVFASEMYGFAAFSEHIGGYLGDKAIGAINLDGLPLQSRDTTVHLAPAGSPFFGDFVMQAILEAPGEDTDLSLRLDERGSYQDDMFLSDSTTGLPTLWVLGARRLWHNSAQEMSIIDPNRLKQVTALNGAWVAEMLTIGPERAEQLVSQAAVYAKERMSKEAQDILDASGAAEQGDTLTREDIVVPLHLRHRREAARLSDFRRVYSGQCIEEALRGLEGEREALMAGLLDELQDALRSESTLTPLDEYTKTIVPRRATRGLPFDLRRAPKTTRKPLPGRVIYGPLAHVLANMAGTKTLHELLRVAEWERQTSFGPGQVKQYVGAIEYLTDYGYLATTYSQSISKQQIKGALRAAGLSDGDLVLVHSGMSYFGHIEGGADTVVDALLEVLGDRGTLLMPTFTYSCVYYDGQFARNRRFRPYHPEKSPVWTGRAPQALARREGARRSVHPTHSVAALGPLAEQCVGEHRESDPPTCRRSPFGKLVDLGGKMMWFGVGLASTTFFHFLEDELDMPYLASGHCRVEDGPGAVRTVIVPKHVPGHRDFYRNPGEETKMYQRLLKDGLVIRKVTLGFGEIKVIEARQMYDLGVEALKDDPRLLLCDNDECLFCRKY